MKILICIEVQIGELTITQVPDLARFNNAKQKFLKKLQGHGISLAEYEELRDLREISKGKF